MAKKRKERTSQQLEALIKRLRTASLGTWRTDADLVHELLTNSRNYASKIAAALGLEVKEVQNALHQGFTEDFASLTSILRISRSLQVTRGEQGPRAEQANDDAEAFIGKTLHDADPNGRVDWQAVFHQVAGPFGVKRLCYNTYTPLARTDSEYPDTDEGNKSYLDASYEADESFVPYREEGVDPLAIGIRRDQSGKLLVAVIEEEVEYDSLVDEDEEDIADALIERYGEGVRGLYVSGGLAPEHGSEGDSKKVKRFTVLDKYCEEVWIDASGSSGAKQYLKDKTHQVEHHFGAVPLVIVPGMEIPHRLMSQSFQGVILSLARLYDNANMANNLAMTLAYKHGVFQEMNADQMRAMLSELDEHPDSLPKLKALLDAAGIRTAYGKVTSISEFVQLFEQAAAKFEAELQDMRARMLIVNLPPDSVDDTDTATIVLAKQAAGQARWKDEMDNLMQADSEIARMICHDIATSEAPWTKGRDGGSKLRFYLSGGETGWFKGKKSLGDRTVSIDVFRRIANKKADIFVTAQTDNEATQAAQEARAQRKRDRGEETLAGVIAAGGEQDVTKKQRELYAENNAKVVGPVAQQGFIQAYQRHQATFLGATTEDEIAVMVQKIQMGQGMQVVGEPGGQRRPEPNGDGFKMSAPNAPAPVAVQT